MKSPRAGRGSAGRPSSRTSQIQGQPARPQPSNPPARFRDRLRSESADRRSVDADPGNPPPIRRLRRAEAIPDPAAPARSPRRRPATRPEPSAADSGSRAAISAQRRAAGPSRASDRDRSSSRISDRSGSPSQPTATPPAPAPPATPPAPALAVSPPAPALAGVPPASLSPQTPLLGRSLAELEAWAVAQGQSAFRGRQLHAWMYDRGARDLAAITVLPKAWRQQLLGQTPPPSGPSNPLTAAATSGAEPAAVATTAPESGPASRPSAELEPSNAPVSIAPTQPPSGMLSAEAWSDPDGMNPGVGALANAGTALIGRLPVLHRSLAADGTVKLLLGTSDGLSLESVGIPSADRLTVCVSSQVGCPMACLFCATGKGGLQRSLAVHEIVDQVLSVREAMQRRPSHVVFMGMGEPLLNIEAVLSAIDCLCRDLGMAQRQITVSTVGVPAALPALAQRALERLGRAQFTLAVSLHAPDQALRQQLIPTARAYPIEALLDDCRRYVALTGRRVSFEYILLGGINDQPRHAAALAARLRGFQSHVNLIAYNPIAEESFRRPTPAAVEGFRRSLEDRHIAVSVRASRGLDADAACGQLRRRLAEQAPGLGGRP